jgi:hypothetical protein
MTIAILAVLSPMILIVLAAAAGALTIWVALFVARVIFWLAIGGLIGLALWAGEARANPLLQLSSQTPLFVCPQSAYHLDK